MDAAVGRTPAELDLQIDYTRQVPSPAALISPEGTYNAGWFERFEGAYNFGDSSAFTMALNRFFHVTLDTPDYYLVWNIADFGRAGNVALQVVEKATGRLEAVSLTRLLRQNQVTISAMIISNQDMNGRIDEFHRTPPAPQCICTRCGGLLVNELLISGVAQTSWNMAQGVVCSVEMSLTLSY